VVPIERGPFYAVKVLPGRFGTFAGLKADANSRVLDANDVPIPGRYAAGTDMASVMGGHYPAGGIISEEPVAQLAGKLLRGNCGRSSTADEQNVKRLSLAPVLLQ
jgi:predicted oxidoreductase